MTKRYFLDTEFMEDGTVIEMLSIGIVCEDGREYYAVSADADWFNANQWVVENVLPYLPHQANGYYVDPNDPTVKPRTQIRDDILAFVAEGGDKPEFWGYYSDYDWVVVAQLFGRMVDLPEHFPKFAMDIKQLAVSHGNHRLPEQTGTKHNALEDARWNYEAYKFLRVGESTKPEYGIDLIAAERKRQISMEGWSPSHDDEYVDDELLYAGIAYAMACDDSVSDSAGNFWPWDMTYWKPSEDKVRNLTKAGALLAAEIDRLRRLNG